MIAILCEKNNNKLEEEIRRIELLSEKYSFVIRINEEGKSRGGVKIARNAERSSSMRR